MPCSQSVKKFLDEEHVHFTVMDHDVADAAGALAVYWHVQQHAIAKVVVAAVSDIDGKRFILLVLPSSEWVSFVALRAQLNAYRIGLAREAELCDLFPDCDLGAMHPFGNLYYRPIAVYVDEGLTHQDTIIFKAGANTVSMRIQYSDFARLVHPIVMKFATPTFSTARSSEDENGATL